MTNEKSLFDRLGGADAIDAVVESFYEKVLAHEVLKRFFVNSNMTNHKPKMKMFLKYAFGGTPNWNGPSMEKAHQGMGVKNAHFDAVMHCLGITLIEFDVPKELIEEAAAIAESVRPSICVDIAEAA